MKPSLHAELIVLQARQQNLEETIRDRLHEAKTLHIQAAVATLSSTLRGVKARIEAISAELIPVESTT